jgi:hypothetical protein
MDVRAAIAGLGGPTAVAAHLGANTKQVSMWGARDSVPAEFLVPFWRACRQAGVTWSPPGAAGLTLSSQEGR